MPPLRATLLVTRHPHDCAGCAYGSLYEELLAKPYRRITTMMTEWHWLVVRFSAAALVLAWALSARADDAEIKAAQAAAAETTRQMEVELGHMQAESRAFWAAQAAEEAEAARHKDAVRAAEQLEDIDHHLHQIEQDRYYRRFEE
jgi:hypothetical protein